MVQVVEYPPSKCEALSSNCQKKKNQKRINDGFDNMKQRFHIQVEKSSILSKIYFLWGVGYEKPMRT
jgi:hypothetical protein